MSTTNLQDEDLIDEDPPSSCNGRTEQTFGSEPTFLLFGTRCDTMWTACQDGDHIILVYCGQSKVNQYEFNG